MSKASTLEGKTISDSYWGCVDSFRFLFEYLQKNGDTPDKLRGAVGQFRVWAENVGAHRHNSTLSLDHRLREATRFRSHVKRLLDDLDDVVKETLAMVSGKLVIPKDDGGEIDSSPQPKTGDILSDEGAVQETSDEEPHEDNIHTATDEICHAISALFRLTVNIQNLSSRDKLERMEKIDVSAFRIFDIKHIGEKYPLTEEGNFLSERLGKANTRDGKSSNTMKSITKR